MKYPPFIKQNSIIELITPSFGCSQDPYKSRLIKAIENITNLGFQIKQNKCNFFDIDFYSYNKQQRYIEFIEAYKNPNSSLLSSVGGGVFMYGLLDMIDFQEIKKYPPKYFMGYSDNTILTFTLTTICDIATIYGPCTSEFGSLSLNKMQLDFFDLLTNKTQNFKGYDKYENLSLKNPDNLYENYNLDTIKILKKYPDSNCSFEGRLIGGCLDVLQILVGTKFDNMKNFINTYKEDGFIWFIENCELDTSAYYRALLQLKNADWFKNVKGFLIGRTSSNEVFGLDKYNAVIEVLKDFNVPIILDCDFGHIKPMMPLLCGSYANVIITDNIKIKYILK